jgi:rhodanese-related sulfurtransferase
VTGEAPAPRLSVDDLLERARARLRRLGPEQALAAQAAGAVLVDVRGDDQIREHGGIPGAIRVPRNVLEWRADPSSPACDPRIARRDAVLVIVCQQGYQSSLAAGNLQDLGLTLATDLIGGFEAWAAAGLPVEAPTGGPGGSSLLIVDSPVPASSPHSQRGSSLHLRSAHADHQEHARDQSRPE